MNWIGCLLILLLSVSVQATELTTFGENIRALGMGGVRVLRDTDASAFFSNPAQLTYMKGMNLEVFNLGLGANGFQTIQDFQGIDTSNLSNFYGRHLWIGAEGHTAFAIPYFGFGAYDQGYIDFELHNPAFPTLDMTYLNDQGFLLGGSVPLGPAGSFGLAVKRIDRMGGPQQIGPDLLNSASLSAEELLEQFQDRGIAYGFDAGLMYRVPAPFNPTLSLAWQDVGSTAFQKTGGSDKPERIKDNLTFALTFQEDVPLLGFAGGIEYRHITDANEQLGKKLHLGAEISLLMFDLRAGFNQGYTTYGVGVDLFILQLEAASYTVERGAYPGQTGETRQQIGLNMSFGFDPDFKLTDMGGKKRRLKQRR
jgi:hypothetical protein